MKKKVNKFTKLLLLITMTIYDLMTPISVLADNILSDAEPNKGDIGINEKVSNNGQSATVSVGSLAKDGDVQVTKTVSKTDTEGRYKIDFEIKGKDVHTSTQVVKPVYVVVVFDKSGSMCEQNNYGNCTNNTKWNNAVSGAKTFATTLLGRITNAQIALVTFSGNDGKKDGAYNDASVVRGFSNSNLNNANFGSADGGTNLQGGLYEANNLLNDSSIPSDAYKYVVVISDGQPTFYYDGNGKTQGTGSSTNANTYNATMTMANTVKSKAEVFAIGYSLPSGTVYNGKTAATILTEVATPDVAGSNITHYIDSNPNAVASAFNNIANSISTSKAGTNAVLTDNIGGAFSIVDSEGNAFVSENIPEITEEGTKLSFYVDIDQDSETGWYNTNEGFNLKYTSPEGKEVTLNCDENPEVYWVQNKYNYNVNYYKDSFENDPFVADTREAANGTVIDINNVEKDKYLNNNTYGTVGYEFNSINPESITITNDGNTKTINVLYTIKSFDYVVNYYYADVNNNYSETPDSSKTVNDVNYGTEVSASDYYLNDSEIREGYKLDTNNSDNNTYTITDGSVVIDIYYNRDNYGYTVKYYFDNSIDTDFTKNSNGIYGSVIYAKDNYLNNTDLNTKNNKDNNDYFLDTNNSSNTSSITIGTDSGKNVLNIYYISTFVTDEDITKNSTSDKITNSSDVVNYTVNYTSKVNNLREGQKVTVVVTDTLPYAIDTDKSDLNNGIYNSDNNTYTITWTFEDTADKFYSEYNVNKEISYSVVYKDFASVSAMEDNTITNSVIGKTTTGGKTSVGATDEEEVPVEINGNLIVHHYEKGTTNSLASDEKSTNLVGKDYTTNYKNDILGYSVDSSSIPSNKDGKYIDGTVEVTYYYVKNNGEIDNPNTDKTGPKTVSSVNGVFDYNITATGSVKEYVGSVKVVATDNLPYKLDTEKSVLDNRCVYDGNKTITCTKDFGTISEEDYTNGVFNVNETFNLKLVFVGIDSDTVVNSATSTIKLDTTEKTTDDETETVVEKGKVTAIYVEKDNETNVLASEESSTGLVGTNYATDSKDVFGYTLVGTPDNKNGVYTKEDITVKYLYTKNDGTIDTPVVVKEGPRYVTSVDSIFNYTLSVDSKITDYVGDATLKVVDTLPYAVDKNKSTIDKRCSYTGDKEITCTVEYKNITEKDYTNGEFVIDEDFDLSLVFVNIDSDKVVNNMTAVIVLDNNKADGNDDVTTEVGKGNVTAIYVEKDNESNVLASEESSNGLVGTDYTTDSKDVFGYTLVGTPDNKDGKYTEEDIIVKYLYTKNEGEIENPDVRKEGPRTINSVDGVFDYTITATGSVKEYVGSVKVVATDSLPYKLDVNKSNIDNRCTYDGNKTLTCTVDYGTISEKDYTNGEFVINETFNLKLVFVGVDSDTVVNSVTSTIKLDTTEKTTDDETETEVFKGTVIATYKDTEGNTLASDVNVGTELAGTDYNTYEQTIYGYTLTGMPSNKDGKYVANETIYVNYVYSKNAGTSTENLSKVGPEVVSSVDSVFDYTVKYNATIKDYVGEARVVITDNLPYDIDLDKSDFGRNCEYTDGKFVCTYVFNIDENNTVIDIEETFNLYYNGIDSTNVINEADAELTYGNTVKENNDEAETLVEEGKVIAKYVDTDGNVIATEESSTGLVGTDYTTDSKDIEGYTLTIVPENKEGKYTNEDIIVTYVYSKNTGNGDVEILPPQTGVEGVSKASFIIHMIIMTLLACLGFKVVNND